MNAARAGNFLIRRLVYDQRVFSGVRCLYTPQFLSIDKYVEARELTQKQFGAMKENFLKRMKHQVENNAAQMVFTDDLKSVVHICESSDLDLCIKMIKKFHSQNKELRFGTFVFGPVVMRMLYHLGATDLALQLIKEKEIDGFFDQLKSYFLLMDLLFEEERYQDILDLNNILQEKQLLDTKFPRDCVVLTCAACYKLNTPESLAYATNLVRETRTTGAEIIQKGLQFIIALAIEQGKPEIAMELISSVLMKNNITINNLRLVTLARLNRVPEAFQILQRKLEEDFPSQAMVRGDICQSSLDVLQETVDKLNDTEKSHQLDQLCRSLKEAAFISMQAINDLLLIPVAPRADLPPRRPGFGYRQPRNEFGGPDEDFPTFQRREPFRRSASDGQRGDFERRDSFRNRFSEGQGPRMQRSEFSQDNFKRRDSFRNHSAGGISVD